MKPSVLRHEYNTWHTTMPNTKANVQLPLLNQIIHYNVNLILFLSWWLTLELFILMSFRTPSYEWSRTWSGVVNCGIDIVNSSPLSATYASVDWASLGSGNGLSPFRRQAITLTNADLVSIEPLGTNFSEIWIEIQHFSFMKMHVKM